MKTKTFTQKEFLDTLFNDGEQVCISNSTYGTAVASVKATYYEDHQFVSINPLEKSRRDDNVTSHRNFLCEFDTGTIEEQLKIIQEIGLPYSTLVFSGGKSLHAIICLQFGLNRELYDKLVKRIYAKLPTVDKSGKNPSRFSRLGDGYRDNGVKQKILDIRPRVRLLELEEWLGPAPKEGTVMNVVQLKPMNRILSGHAWHFLSFGAEDGKWNKSLFMTTLEMTRANFPKEEILQRLEAVTGFLTPADRRTISSAMKIAESENK